MAIYSSTQSTSPEHAEIRVYGCHINEPLLNTEETKGGGCVDSPKNQPQGTTFPRTLLNGLNALSGVGILSIPYALSEGGWLSLIPFLLVAIICCYTGLLLRRCIDADARIETYPDIGKHAFGSKGKITIALFMYLELYLVAIEFLILEGDNLEKLFPNTDFEIMGLKIGGKQGFVLLTALVILPTMWLRSLGLLAYVSAGGVLASITLVASVFWTGAVDGVGFHGRGAFFNLSGLPTGISVYAFCYCGHAVFPTIYTSMKDRSQFSKMLILCFAICTFNYGTMAILGYLMYGEDVKSQVTLNLPVGKIGSKIAIYTTLINPFTKYALMVTPIAGAIEDQLHINNKRTNSLLIRTLLVTSTVIVALTVPLFAYLMAFIGSFLSSMVSMVLPCICYLKISKASRSQTEFMIIVGILVIGVFVAITGTYYSLRQIVEHL
ncbi:amino acid transporter AVT1J-like [Magnolia sinica]|uniref:amino acid transporter AVT1J-like n=1 Tax=Magnolia sinica TaxID=86752 RepID=UPI002657F128|nr:amino acid transporter AVT1J-like [Magnolia sinica]